MTRLALLSDIHANLPALEAVLEDSRAEGCTQWYCLGDLVGTGPFPREVIDVIRTLDVPCLMGNVDRNVLRIKEKLEGYRLKHKWDKAVSYSWTAAQLDESSRRYLEGLPAERRLEIDAVPIHLVHGTLGSDSIGLRAGMGEREAERLLRQSKARLLACGHTHLAFVLELAEGVLANCGSVGRPYDGALGASYLVVDTAPRLVVQVRTVPYDSLALQAGFEARGLPASFFEAISSGRGFTPRDQDNLRAWDQIQATRR